MEQDRVSQLRLKVRDGSSSNSGDHKNLSQTKIAGEEGKQSIRKVVVDWVNDSVRVCPRCEKWFNSGQALGGHLRIHNQARRKVKRKMKKAEEGSDSIKVSQVLPCSLCDKTFQSPKSLAAHIKAHPRSWRGNQTPRHAQKNSKMDTELDAQVDSSFVTEKPAVNLMESLQGRTVTRKRSRPVIFDLEKKKKEDKQVRRAAETLMMMSEDRSISHQVMTKKQRVEASKNYSDIYASRFTQSSCKFPKGTLSIKEGMANSNRVDDISEIERGKMEKAIKMVFLEIESEDSMSKSYDSEETIEEYKESTSKLNWKSKVSDVRKISGDIYRHHQDQDRSRRGYERNICNKCFPRNQAVDGHNRTKKTSGEKGQSNEEPLSGEHEKCKSCNRIFSTGLALKEHKRRHWIASLSKNLFSSSQGILSPADGTSMERNGCDFDLSEPPSEDDM